VAKVFKKQSKKMLAAAYFDEAFTQMAAECFAQDFNRYAARVLLGAVPQQVRAL
jgi:hypothetical protein